MDDKMEISLVEAVGDLNPDHVLELITSCSQHSQEPPLTSDQVRCIFHQAVDAFLQRPSDVSQAAQMVYLLRNMGAHINRQDQNGCTPLLRYLQSGLAQPDVVEAFLRCNADVYITDKNGVYPLEVITTCHTLTTEVRDVFMKYVPGIWEAVEGDDAMNVRKLINEWCRVDVQKNNKTLLQLALDMGTESIIRVVSGIRPSMEFAHCVLAGDVATARKMLRLSQKLKLNINFRNMGDRGRTPLYYAMRQANLPMVHMLLEFGARIDITMKGDAECDIPLYIAALEEKPPLSIELLKLITPTGPGITVDSLFYKGKNVLFHCVDNDTHQSVIDYILQKGSAYLVTQRIPTNLCAKDYAELHKCKKVVASIENAVLRWMFHEAGINRQILVLQGYQYLPAPIKSLDGVESQADGSIDAYYKYLPLYQDQVEQVHAAVENLDVETLRQLLYFRHNEPHGLSPCLADCRRPGDGQPLLHKAALRGSYDMLELLAETLVYQRKQRLDSIRDQYFRTCLHYTYALEDGKHLVDLLMDYGASEFTMDKDNRSPLCFKDRRGQPLMRELLEYQLLQDFHEAEPDPWAVPMPVPIIGYILSCAHGHCNPDHLPEKLAALPCGSKTDLQRYRSLSDTKLHKINKGVNKSPTIASQLASIPSVLLGSRMANKAYHRCTGNKCMMGMDRDYFPLPTDEAYDDNDDYAEYDEGPSWRK
ncbi:serine/threonine-protein phosphatase 6 regulatory ankyrin repeat subunit A-like isoform X2 [Littorina saxatilis]|uniref:serine/threonine-protein phosphatase 6 regulatory ankyrin repeat subunit A-like isoform X2 n=1 Tax=Littorina saxatilis TaxID=31220 RepID=UPI0038B57000